MDDKNFIGFGQCALDMKEVAFFNVNLELIKPRITIVLRSGYVMHHDFDGTENNKTTYNFLLERLYENFKLKVPEDLKNI